MDVSYALVEKIKKLNIESKIKSKIDSIHIVCIMILIYTVFFSYYTIYKHYTFQTNAYDLGIFLQSFYNTLHEGKLLYTTLWEGSRFQNHFSPILFLILPIYAIFPRAETLLILQSFILALGALPIYWIARNEINKKAGVIFALLYLMYPALHGVNRYDFHEVALAPTLILFAFHYFKEKRYRLSTIFITLALISREDVAMVVVPMALYWLWERRSEKGLSLKDIETVFPISIIIAGLIWFYIGIGVVIPHYNPEGYFFISEYKLEYLLQDLNKKFDYIVDLFFPLLFTSLFTSLILIPLPVFIRNLFPDRTSRYKITNQHPALIIPFVFISSIYFVKQISEYIKDDSIKDLFTNKLLYPLLIIMIIISFFTSPIPKENMPEITPHHYALEEVISNIPKNASVYTQNNIFPHLADRARVYYVPGDRLIFKGWNNPQTGMFVHWKGADFEYILIDDSDKKWSTLRKMDLRSLDILIKNYGLYIAIDKIYLFKKNYNGTTNILSLGLMDNFNYTGLIASYYNNDELKGTPVFVDRVRNIDFKWKGDSPARGLVDENNFSIKFEGYLFIPINDTYSFQLHSNNGARLFLDDKLIIDKWNATYINADFQFYLNKGMYKIRVDYRDRKTRNAYIRLDWLSSWNAKRFAPISEISKDRSEEYFYVINKKDNINHIDIGDINITNNDNIEKEK